MDKAVMESFYRTLSPQLNSELPDHLSQRIAQSEGVHSEPSTVSGRSFGEILKDSVEKANLDQHQADTAIKELVAGRSKNIHETMLSIEKADSSLKLMMQVRNKILDAYKEIMRMQV